MPPILYTTFMHEVGISLAEIGNLIANSFVIVLIVEFFAVFIADKVGYRRITVAAHILMTAGFLLMGIGPGILGMGKAGLYISVVVYSIGCGGTEMILSPLIDALPSDRNSSRMSFLHSCYCWGEVATMLIATMIIKITAGGLWWMLPIGFAAVPAVNIYLFLKVPVIDQVKGHEKLPVMYLISNKRFAAFLIAMAAAGAAEQIIVQWSSSMLEISVHIPKMTGDLLGPCLFAGLMGVGRMLHSLKFHKYPITDLLLICSVTCLLFYLFIAFSSVPFIVMICCGLCGLSVSIMWPGMISCCAAKIPAGGTAMFGMLAISGDVGCIASIWLMGVLGQKFGLHDSIAYVLFFPVILLIMMIFLFFSSKKKTSESN